MPTRTFGGNYKVPNAAIEPVPVAARSKAARLLRSWVRIPPAARMSCLLSVVCCQVEVSATS